MYLILGSRITVVNPTDEISKWCKDNLILSNPEYTKKQRMGFWVGNTPKTISLYEKHGNDLVLPYGCLYDIQKFPIEQMYPDFTENEKVDFHAEIPLYDYQETAKNEMLKSVCGILQSPAGSGKTQTMLAVAAAIGRKTLWIAHTKDLVLQSKERAERYIPSELIGTITEGKVEIGSVITFATVQTLSKLDLGRYKDEWDCVIVDEAHRISGSPTNLTMYAKVLNSLYARRKYGMTATVHRSDGMIKATESLIGKVVYHVPDSAVSEKIMTVNIMPVQTQVGLDDCCIGTDGMLIYSNLINYLAFDECRNSMILTDLICNRFHYCLILSDRLAQLEYLKNSLPDDLREQAVMIDGKMVSKTAKQEREQALEDMRQGKKRYLFATYALAKEGLDIPRLDRLFFATPVKDYAVVTQSIGRIARTFDGKQDPIVYDYVDNNVKYLVKSYKKRCTTYRKSNCRFL